MADSYEDILSELSRSKHWGHLEEVRKIALRRRVYAWILGFFLLVLSLGMMLFGSGDVVFSGFGGLFVSVFITRYCLRIVRKTYSAEYKKLFIPPLVTSVITQAANSDTQASRGNGSQRNQPANRCSFYHDRHINISLLQRIPLFAKYVGDDLIFHGEDLFSGKINKTDFQFSDFLIKREYKSKLVDQTFEFTIFRGLVFIADFHKAFEGTTTLMSRKGKKYKRQRMIGSRMNTVSHEFDRLFRTTTTDEITARYLLPANIIERIIHLRKLFPKNGVSICLHNGIVVIAIQDVDYFEADGLNKPESKAVRHTYEQIQTLVSIIELLNLNIRIWNKRNEKDFYATTSSHD